MLQKLICYLLGHSPSEQYSDGDYANGISPTFHCLRLCDTSTAVFKKCYLYAEEIRLINHRIKFDGATGSPRFASMIVVINGANCLANALPEVTLVDYRKFIK